jgi:shikimate dehydrogenase
MISGTTKLYTIIADPISQVRTPETFNKFFKRQGLDAVLVPVAVEAAKLKAVIDGFRGMKNLGGFIVTVPHKKSMSLLCDALGETARVVGAVNAVRREQDGTLVGDTFDGAGFVSGLKSQGIEPAGKCVLLLGAGGAAGSIALALAGAGVSYLRIANRTSGKAEGVAEYILREYPSFHLEVGSADPTGFDLIVNATSLGMTADDALPLDLDKLDTGVVVADIIMRPEITPLLYAAAEKGCRIHLGRHMLDAQLRLISEFLGMVETSKCDLGC